MPSLRPSLSLDGKSMTVRVPLSIRKRGGRKLVIAPDDLTVAPMRADRLVDNPVVKAIARAFRWREMLESGSYVTIREIAHVEKINESYVGRVLRLSLLAPDIVEATLDGRQPAHLQLNTLLQQFPIDWPKQRAAFKLAT
jgi:hypothetical protein